MDSPSQLFVSTLRLPPLELTDADRQLIDDKAKTSFESVSHRMKLQPHKKGDVQLWR